MIPAAGLVCACFSVADRFSSHSSRLVLRPALLHHLPGPFRRLRNSNSVADFAQQETLEASIIISVLLSLVENLFDRSNSAQSTIVEGEQADDAETPAQRKHRLVRRMKMQIWAGAGTGLLIAFCIGAAFIAVVSLPFASKMKRLLIPTFSLVLHYPLRYLGSIRGALGGLFLARCLVRHAPQSIALPS